jgi:MFS family permease
LSFSTFSITYVLVAPVAGRLADRSGRWRRLLIAHLIYGVVVLLYGLVPSVPVILILGLVEGAIVGTTQPAVDAYLSIAADQRIQGRVQGAFMTIGMAGAGISALLGSILYGYAAMTPFVVGGVVLVALSLLGVSFIREAEERSEVHRPATVPDVRPSFDDPAGALLVESGADELEREPVIAGERR